MRLGIMQPYFFPYLGHFSLIASVDKWIVFDVTQYTPKSWISRNRILHPKEGWQYVSIALANSSRSIQIHEAKILDIQKSKDALIGKLSHYKYAPFFSQVMEIIDASFGFSKGDSLVNLNINTLKFVCDYLKIPFHYQKATELPVIYPEQMAPGDWAPFICSELGASEYINPMNGQSIFDKSLFEQKEISLGLCHFTGFQYEVGKFEHQSQLSILDVMMWNPPEEILKAIRCGTEITWV